MLVAYRWRAMLMGFVVIAVGIGLDIGQTTGIILVNVPVQVGRLLWIVAVIATGLVAPFQAFQKVRRERDKALAELGAGTNPAMLVERLRGQPIMLKYSDGSEYGGTQAELLEISKQALSFGAREFTLQDAIQHATTEPYNDVLGLWKLYGLVTTEYRDPAPGHPSAVRQSIHELPYQYYQLTELGRQVILRL